MISVDRQAYTLDVLNKLYAAEKRSLLPRLAEMGVFVQWAKAHELEQVRRMTAEHARHCEWLDDAAQSAGGSLDPACADVATANLHYCDLRLLLPRVIRNVHALIEHYGQVMKERAALVSQAAEVVARIYNRHQVHLDQLEQLKTRLESA